MKLQENYPYYLANKAIYANNDLDVFDKFSGNLACRVAMADHAAIDQAIAAALEAERPMARLPGYKRQQVLNHCVNRFSARREELAHYLCIEAGKPIKYSHGEVERLIETFKIAAEQAVNTTGSYENLDRSPRTTGYTATTKKVPVGACSFISPFNFPLNLAAHKIAPAIAAGCPFVLKPASLTPLGALIIGEVLAECDLPKGAFSILPCRRDGARLFTEDDRLKLLSFTGSPEVGWALKARAGKKKMILELGGNAACVVDEDTNIDDAVARIIVGAFYQSGQSCISVQRIYVHEEIADQFIGKLTESTQKLKMGNPLEKDTFIGPMISDKEARRVKSWIDQAIAAGARILCGGGRDGSFVEATLLTGVRPDLDLAAKEAFGPVAVIETFDDFATVLEKVNDSDFGLQAGIFTRDIHKAHLAWDVLEVGGVLINEIPSWRADQMPYGGVKDSGLGREGIIYAIDHMSELRTMIVRTEKP